MWLQGGEGPHLVANAAFLAEKTAKEGAEAKLATLRRTTAHKDDLLKTLKAKACPPHCTHMLQCAALLPEPAASTCHLLLHQGISQMFLTAKRA